MSRRCHLLPPLLQLRHRTTREPTRALGFLCAASNVGARPSRTRALSSSTLVSSKKEADKESADYAAALAKLDLLASNRAVTGLFDKKTQQQQQQQQQAAKDHLNAQAIPEMIEWLRRAGYTPQDLAAMRHIHVAGTKGKGSVCAFATSLLRAHYRSCSSGSRSHLVGTYTSPHLVSPRERIAIDGEPVSQAVFATAVSELWGRFTAAALAAGQTRAVAEGPRSKPFYFRFLTILAWHLFLSAGVRDVVMECGIGGEYDATNVLPAEAVSAAVVTRLGVDHVAMLGGTPDSIAWHKAGIFKPGLTAFTLGPRRHRHRDEKHRHDPGPGPSPGAPPADNDVVAVLRRRAAEKGVAELVELDQDVVDAWPGVESELRGAFQKSNQALAVLAVQEHLGLRDERASTAETLARLVSGATTTTSTTFARGLGEARLRGRCEVLRREQDPGTEWMLDGAHTMDSIEEVARWLTATVQSDPGGHDGDGDGYGTNNSPNNNNNDNDNDNNSRRKHSPVVLVFNQQERDAPALLKHLVETVQAESGRTDTDTDNANRNGVVFSHAMFTRNELVAQHAGAVDLSVQHAAAATIKTLVPGCEVRVFDNVRSAVAAAREAISSGRCRGAGRGRPRILVTGSLHLVGGVLRTIEPDSLL